MQETRTMENLEYSFILKEIEKLVGNRFEKIQEIEKGKVSLKIGKERIVCELGIRLNIAYELESGESNTNFIQKIRKDLKGFKFKKIFQHNQDRVIVFEFENREGNKKLIFEMFGKGNIILVQDEKTVICYKRERWTDREIKPNAEYKFPKSNIVMNLKDTLSEKYIVSCMMRLPLGKKYVKEILGRVGIEEKTPGNELKIEEIKNIEKEIEKLYGELEPFGFYKGGEIVDYGLVEFEEHSELEKKKVSSLSEIIDGYHNINKKENKEKSKKIKKLEKRLEEQKKSLEELKEKEKKYKEIGDKIYEKYSEIEEILKENKKRKIEIEL